MNSLSTTTTRHFKRFYSLQLRSNKFSSQTFKKQQNSLKFLNTNLNNVSLSTSALASRSNAASFLSTRHFSSKKQTVVKTGGDVNDKPASKKAVDALMMKAVMLANEDKMEESRAVLQDAVEQYRKMKSTDGIIRSLNTLALLHAKERNYLECCAALTECVELARTLPDGKEMLQKLLQQLGTSYAEAERDDSARETLKEALELAKELKIAGAQGLANLSLGALASPLRGRKGAIYQTAVRHLNAAIKNFEMADDVDHQLKCTVLLAREHHGAQNLDLSNQVWDQVLQICEPMPSRVEEWEAYYGLAENYANMGDEHLKLCLDSYKEALSTAEQLKNSQLQMMTLQSLGLAYFASKQHSEALETAEKFHELARTAGDNINAVVQSLIQMARFTEPIDIKQALQQYEAAVSAAVSKAPGSEAEAMAVARLADARRRNDEDAIAMQLFEKCVRICKKLGDPPLTIEVLTNLGQLHQKSQSYKEAISCLKRAEEISEGVLGADLHRLNLLMLMGQIYRSMNKPIQANDALAKGMTLAGALHRQGVIKDLPQEFKDALEQGQKESAEEQK